MRGEYLIIHPETREVLEVIPNGLVEEGQENLVNAFFNKDAITDWSFVVGLFNEVVAYATTALAQYTTEPTIGVNGYARVTVNPIGWTIVNVDEEVYAESPDLTFTAAGGDFDAAITRMFCHLRIEDPAASFTEYLLSVSSALANAKTVVDTESYVVRYRIYFG